MCIYYLYNTSDTGLADRKIAATNTTTTSNGLISNDTTPNGLISNDTTPNGLISNDTTPNGLISNDTTPNGLISNTTELNDIINTTLNYIYDLYYQAKEKIYAHELDVFCIDKLFSKKATELLINVHEDETKSREYWKDLYIFLNNYCKSSLEDRANIQIPEEFKEDLANFLSE